MRTWSAKPNEVKRDWWVVDADGQVCGRLATQVANILRGKHKPQFTPHVDTGDFVIVLNCEKIKLTGNKKESKIYYKHTGFVGSLKEKTAQQVLDENPEQVVTQAVRGMLPKNRLSRKLIKKLKVYKGDKHPHLAQNPKAMGGFMGEGVKEAP